MNVQAEPIKKSNSFEKEATELKAKIYSKNYIGEAEDSSDTDSSFGDIDSENEVKKSLKFYFSISIFNQNLKAFLTIL